MLQQIFRFLVPKKSNSSGVITSIRLDSLDWIPFFRNWKQNHFLRRLSRLIPVTFRQRHLFCVGRTGSGKSEVLKAFAVLNKRDWSKSGQKIRRGQSLVLIDPHGDFCEELAAQMMYFQDFRLHPESPDLVYIDPSLGRDQNRFPVLNPFDIWDKKYNQYQIAKHAQQLAKVIQTLSCGHDAGLSRNMETLLMPCITVLLKRPGSTILDLHRFMTERNEDLVALGCTSQTMAHRVFFQSSFRSKRFEATKMALFMRLQSLLNHTVFSQMIAGKRSSIDLERALNSGTSIIVNCAQGQLGTDVARAIGSFVVAMTLSTAFNRAEKGAPSHRVPIWLVVDEMQHFVSPEIKTILTEARKFGLSLSLATQVVGQDMTKSLQDILLGNTAVKVCGDAGAHTRKAMSKEMEIKESGLLGLRTGQFVIKSGSLPARTVRMSRCFILPSSAGLLKMSDWSRKRHGLMTTEQWNDLMSWQLDRYYPPVKSSEEGEVSDEDQQLLEDIHHEYLPNLLPDGDSPFPLDLDI